MTFFNRTNKLSIIKDFAHQNNICLHSDFMDALKKIDSVIFFKDNLPSFIKDSKKIKPRSIFNDAMYGLLNTDSKELLSKVIDVFKIDELIDSDSDTKLLFWLPYISIK